MPAKCAPAPDVPAVGVSAYPAAQPKQNIDISQDSAKQGIGDRRLVFFLMAPTLLMVLTASSFGVALPAIRTHFAMGADAAAWMVTAYTLPFMMFMPLYGRLGDALGKRNLLVAGMGLFFAGTLLLFRAQRLPLFVAGRVIQGVGLAAVSPLSMAIISQRFPPHRRGQALGLWNSAGPLTGILAPLIAGLLIDAVGWRMTFLPLLIVAPLASAVIFWGIPSSGRTVRLSYLRRFDWPGVLLLAATLTLFVFFLSSRVITGVAPLHDMRLLTATLVAGVLLVVYEQRKADPFLNLGLFRTRSLRMASIIACTRMFAMSGINFLMPLFLADVHHLRASTIGLLVMLGATTLFITMYWGGRGADRGGTRRLITMGLGIQALALLSFGFLPAGAPIALIAAGLMLHGFGAGFPLAPLHRAAMSQVEAAQAGAAAGIYSMIRFSGTLLGATLGGVLLEQMLSNHVPPAGAYRTVFCVIAAAAVTGALLGRVIDN